MCLDTSNSKCQDVQHCIMQLAGRGLVLNIVGSEIRRENQLRLVVEIPLFTRFWDTSQVVVWDFFHQQYYFVRHLQGFL